MEESLAAETIYKTYLDINRPSIFLRVCLIKAGYFFASISIRIGEDLHRTLMQNSTDLHDKEDKRLGIVGALSHGRSVCC